MTAISSATGATTVDERREEQERDLEEGDDGLALGRDEVELAERLGQPDGGRKRDQGQEERAEHPVENVALDELHASSPQAEPRRPRL